MMRDNGLASRIRTIGRKIFDLAGAAQPRVWQSAWWLEQATRMLDHDERLRTRAFQFVDCLPSLRTNTEIARHVAEYFDPRQVRLPAIFRAAVGPGRLRTLREDLIGRAARMGATRMAGRFITGYDVPSVIRTIRRLRRSGMAFTLDVLGEFTTSDARADGYAAVYHDLIDRITPIARAW